MQYPNLKYLILSFFSLAIFSLSCKKVINVKLRNAASQIVITGEVNNLPGPYTVTIYRSVTYTTDNVFPAVSGAHVLITGNGTVDTLSETGPGTYVTHSLVGAPGQTYSLQVLADGQQYNAASTMPQPVAIDSISFIQRRGGNNLNAIVYFKDPALVSNYYQFIEYSNGKPLPGNRGTDVFDDRLSDGRNISLTLDDDSTDIKRGDILTVRLNAIDKLVYEYLNELRQISRNGGGGFSSPTPANPVTNISNGSLGYFTAQSVETKQKMVE